VTPEITADTLHARALRSYERGRLTIAARAALLVILLTAICARETEAYTRCAAIGVLLLVATIGVRWRQWRGIRAANAGLLTGVLPMTAALVLCRFAAAWPPEAAIATCTSAGLIAGALAVRATMEPLDADWPEWVAASLIAGLTAALGCIGIGFGTAIGGGLGVAAGAVVATRSRSTYTPRI
jgi:hypothetical protein